MILSCMIFRSLNKLALLCLPNTHTHSLSPSHSLLRTYKDTKTFTQIVWESKSARLHKHLKQPHTLPPNSPGLLNQKTEDFTEFCRTNRRFSFTHTHTHTHTHINASNASSEGEITEWELKGTYYAKITFIRCLNSCVAAVCENNQPIMVKIHPLIYL